MTTSRINAYRWPARLVSHKPFAAGDILSHLRLFGKMFFQKLRFSFIFLLSFFCARCTIFCRIFCSILGKAGVIPAFTAFSRSVVTANFPIAFQDRAAMTENRPAAPLLPLRSRRCTLSVKMDYRSVRRPHDKNNKCHSYGQSKAEAIFISSSAALPALPAA